MPLGPLRFKPIFTKNLWGGRQLPERLHQPQPEHADAIGEAWVLSDVDGSPSRVADGPLKGTTLRELLADRPERILGSAKPINGRFPLLLKFIDARQELSVQVHPNDAQAARSKPGANGKTEAWVILEANPATSRIYSGFQPGMTEAKFRAALASKTAADTLHHFIPTPGECVFLPAGTVHAIGADILLFEVQQTSDITYRLYDWDRVDPITKLPRELHIEQGLAVSDFASGPCPAAATVKLNESCEELVNCEYFTLRRWKSQRRFTVGAPGECRIVVVLESSGRGEIEWSEDVDGLRNGDVLLIPAETGACEILPSGTITLLECSLSAARV